MDSWFEGTVQPRLKGPAFMVRYADDLLVVCRREVDARKVLDVLPKRFGKYGLTLHPDKTQIVRFLRPPLQPQRLARERRPGSFDFLGFTHYWGRSQKGNWVVRRKTALSRFNRALKAVDGWMRQHYHEPVSEQCRALRRKLFGHYAYYGITGNARSLQRFRHQVERRWRKRLNRRSQRAWLDWERFDRLLVRYPLPPARVVHANCPRAANPCFEEPDA